MDKLVKFIAENLVDKPDEVRVAVKEEEQSTIIELTVAPEDMGKVIGKQGRIAKATRTVVKAASAREDKRYVVEIV
ncbi:MAG TPA: KH domain-containing protein [Clostridia bacterium]|nr:KH domain-containing protein [Clostridia bacterium]